MKILPVTGRSGSGKTRFIIGLLDELNRRCPGRVAVIKHLAHHAYKLEEGKDTTVYFEHGAAMAAGIDSEKASVTVAAGTCESTLEYLADCGMKYAIIEGFKEKTYGKIVLGDLEIERALMRNPTVDEVAASLGKFDDYHTMQSLVCELEEEADKARTGAILTYTGIVREITGEEKTGYMDFEDSRLLDTVAADIARKMAQVPGVRGAKLYHRKGRLYAGEDILYIAVASSHREEGFKAMMDAVD